MKKLERKQNVRIFFFYHIPSILSIFFYFSWIFLGFFHPQEFQSWSSQTLLSFFHPQEFQSGRGLEQLNKEA